MKLLVVDDEQSNLDEIKEALIKSGINAEAVFFSNPIAALEAVKKEDFEAAFLDIQMPLMTGLELAEQILDIKPNMETVFITAYNYYATEAFEVNAIDYILKPIRYERFEKALKKLIETKKKNILKPAHRHCAIFTLGDKKLLCGEEEVRWNRTKTGELFYYLLMHKGKKVHKELICEDLWPKIDYNKALANLQVTVYRLRQNLKCFDKKQLHIDYINNSYSLNLGNGYYDIDEFENQIAVSEIKSLEKAVSIYTGDYLNNEGWLWSEPEKERLRQKYEIIIERLADIYIDNKSFDKAEILLLDYIAKEIPGERISILLLRITALSGSKQQLDRVYGKLEEKYKRLLGMEVTRDLKLEYTRLSKINNS